MISLDGKTALVSGASSGIGLIAALKLARMGAKVVMVARNPSRGDAALEEARTRSGAASRISMLYCDFGSQTQIRQLAADFRKQHDRLHILVNNAGSVSDRRQVTEDGLEQTFAVNHLGYFLLTTLLLDLIEASAPARIVNVASVGHYKGDMAFDDLQYEHGYGIMKAYQRSKLGNVLFSLELARRLADKGVTVNAMHPGGVATQIWSRTPRFAQPILAVAKLAMVTPEEGGDRIVYLATSPEVEGKTGGYYEKDRLRTPSELARDTALQAKLWTVSEQLTSIRA